MDHGALPDALWPRPLSGGIRPHQSETVLRTHDVQRTGSSTRQHPGWPVCIRVGDSREQAMGPEINGRPNPRLKPLQILACLFEFGEESFLGLELARVDA